MKKALLKTIRESIHPSFEVNEVTLSYKRKVPKYAQGVFITGAKDSYDVFKSVWDYNTIDFKEDFKIMLLSRANKVLAVSNVSSGGKSGAMGDPAIILSTALLINASSIILAHNHPSGMLQASPQDKIMTEEIKNACKCHAIKLLDHIILTSNEDGLYPYFSFAEEGLL